LYVIEPVVGPVSFRPFLSPSPGPGCDWHRTWTVAPGSGWSPLRDHACTSSVCATLKPVPQSHGAGKRAMTRRSRSTAPACRLTDFPLHLRSLHSLRRLRLCRRRRPELAHRRARSRGSPLRRGSRLRLDVSAPGPRHRSARLVPHFVAPLL